MSTLPTRGRDLNPNREPKPTSFAYVHDGRVCVGHVLERGSAGFEAFDDYDISLGIFPTADAAVETLITAARIRHGGKP